MKNRAVIFCILAGLMWGSSGVFSNLLSPYGFSPLQLTATRGIVSGIAVAVYVLIYNKKLFHITGRQLALFALGGATVFCTASLYYVAMRHSSVSTAAVLMNTSPAFVMGFSVIFFHEKLTKRKLFGLIVMLTGCMLVSGILSGGLNFNPFGVLMGILSGLSYSIYSIIAKEEVLRGYHSLSATLYHFMIMGLIGLFFLDLPTYIPCVAKAPLPVIPLLIGIGLVTCVIPYFMFSLSLKYVPVGTAAALGVIEPMSATIYSVTFFPEKEHLTVPAVIGIVLILGACLVFSTIREDA
ncbi:MAG: hypothetical protein E7580_04260 [Ruminococcaceae bacterium]|nr:hypothetical protein [Oscillospiraceae bacterium]